MELPFKNNTIFLDRIQCFFLSLLVSSLYQVISNDRSYFIFVSQ